MTEDNKNSERRGRYWTTPIVDGTSEVENDRGVCVSGQFADM